LVTLAGRELGKGVPPVHPKVHPETLLQENKDIRKTGRWVTEKHQNLFSLQRPAQYLLRSLKTSVTFEI